MCAHEKDNEINNLNTSSGPTKVFEYQWLMADFALKWAKSASLSPQHSV
jgi:hypothetical protein